MPDNSALLSLPYILPAQAQKHVTHNEAISQLDVIVQLAVTARNLATPPATPAQNDRYIVAAAATGAWAGKSGNIALYDSGAWAFYAPNAGWTAWVSAEKLLASFDGEGAPAPQRYDRVLVATGRRPNGREIGAEAAGVAVDERGYIPVDRQQRTNVAHIFAVGDIVGEPMLAHKASHEAKVAAEALAGHKAFFDSLTIPSVAYTDPEVAWMGLTETAAKAAGIAFEKAVFPWAASGRARAVDRTEGSTKLLFDPQSKRLLGAGIVGPNAGELIAELVLALEMGADLNDIALTIHPHPTLSETAGLAAEAGLGTITDLFVAQKK